VCVYESEYVCVCMRVNMCVCMSGLLEGSIS